MMVADKMSYRPNRPIGPNRLNRPNRLIGPIAIMTIKTLRLKDH